MPATRTPTVKRFQDELADREAIRDTLMRYCRGIDRFDEALLRSAYWPDALDDHLAYKGDVEGFINYARPIIGAMRYSQHMIGNILIAIDGDTADVESYFQGYQSVPDDAGIRRDVIAGGRYLDTFERRKDEWRIIKRFVVTDWFREFSDTGDWEIGPFGMPNVERGDLKPADMSYRFFTIL